MALLACCGLLVLASVGNTQELAPVVEAEKSVYIYEPADNGAGPLWCYGNTCLVRIGPYVFVIGLETLPGIKPLNNVGWVLYKRTEQGWKVQQKDPDRRTREPCPFAGFPNGNLFLSTNPTLTPPNTYNGPVRPQVLRFNTTVPTSAPATLEPVWEGTPEFTEHSYRGLCADGARRELLLFNIEGHHGYYWSLRSWIPKRMRLPPSTRNNSPAQPNRVWWKH